MNEVILVALLAALGLCGAAAWLLRNRLRRRRDAERARLAAELAGEQRRAAARAEDARLAAVRAEAERAERDRLSAEQAARDRVVAERAAQDRAAEQAERDRQAAARVQQAEHRRAAAAQAARDRAAAELAEAQRSAAAHALAERAAALAARQAERGKDASETLVMVADDSKLVRVKTGRVLAAQGYRVCYAEDGLDALRQLQAVLPDVVITDVEMPELDGFGLTRHIRATPSSAHIPVIMITAADERHRADAEEAGVTRVLGKPYRDEDLISTIRGAMRADAVQPAAVS